MIRQIPVYRGSEHVATYAEDDPCIRVMFSRKQARFRRGNNGHVFLLLTEDAPILASEKPDKAAELRKLNTKYTMLETLGVISPVTGCFEATGKCYSFTDIQRHPAHLYRTVQLGCMVTA